MKKLTSFIIAFALILSACTGKSTTQQSPEKSTPEIVYSTPVTDVPVTETPAAVGYKLSDFFPMSKDVHMVYKGTGNEFAGYETYVDYVKDNLLQTRNINGTISVIVYQLLDGILKKVYTQGEIYHRYDYTLLKNCDEIIIKEPIKVGTKWTLKDGTIRSITAIDKEVETPLKKYKALEITTQSSESKTLEYYAKDVGLIKRVFISNDSYQVISEVEKIENDVPYKHEVSFYFPDFENNRVMYVHRDVEINTNQDMKFKFQKELKTIPEGSKLVRVLTPGVKVNSMTLDEKNKTVTVDFSKELINEMNVGAGLELLILKSIVSTFGDYYNVRKVSITIDGKAYSSGHIILNPGEYLDVDTSTTKEYK